MNIYEVHYFDKISWCEKDKIVIALSEEEIKNALDYSYYGDVRIELVNGINTPYVLDSYDNSF